MPRPQTRVEYTQPTLEQLENRCIKVPCLVVERLAMKVLHLQHCIFSLTALCWTLKAEALEFDNQKLKFLHLVSPERFELKIRSDLLC